MEKKILGFRNMQEKLEKSMWVQQKRNVGAAVEKHIISSGPKV